MADAFFALSPADRRDALEVAAARSGRAVHLLEKDAWVVWTLKALFESDFADHLVFKGGTSLSKAYHAIGRFSEDFDLTYDIRVIAPDLAPDSAHAIPSTRSQEQRWTKTIRDRLGAWVSETVAPLLARHLAEGGLSGRATVEADTVLLTYEALASGSGYVRPVVLLEFGARSTGEPVFCRGGRFRGAERFSRHWYDVASLDNTAWVASALADRDLARRVAEHKTMFFRERDGQGDVIDYGAAVMGALQLAPDGPAVELLAGDYAGMVSDGLLFERPPLFAELVARCRTIQDRANNIGVSPPQ